MGLPWWLSGKESACNAGDSGDTGLIPGLGRSPGGGHGNSLQYSCLENSMDRGAWWATFCGVAKSQTLLKQLSMQAHAIKYMHIIKLQFSPLDTLFDLYTNPCVGITATLFVITYKVRISQMSHLHK